MKYNKKEFIKPDGRRLRGGGPRDLQRKQATQDRPAADLTEYLQSEIRRLNEEIAKSGSGEYTGEQVDEEIRKAVAAAVMETKVSSDGELQITKEVFRKKENDFFERIKELELEHGILKNDLDRFRLEKDTVVSEKKELEFEIEQHKKQVSTVNEGKITRLLKEQNQKIESLMEALANAEEQLEIETNRPKMEMAFIDPLTKDAGEGLVPHLETKQQGSSVEKVEMDAQIKQLKRFMGKLPDVKG